MHRHLVYIPEPNVGVQGLAEQASFFLMAVCIRYVICRPYFSLGDLRVLT